MGLVVEPSTTILAAALTSTAAAAVLPWVAREDEAALSPQRKLLFAVLLLDAGIQWATLAQAAAPPLPPTWIVTAVILLATNLVVGGYLLIRGFMLPGVVRFPAAAILALVEPILIILILGSDEVM